MTDDGSGRACSAHSKGAGRLLRSRRESRVLVRESAWDHFCGTAAQGAPQRRSGRERVGSQRLARTAAGGRISGCVDRTRGVTASGEPGRSGSSPPPPHLSQGSRVLSSSSGSICSRDQHPLPQFGSARPNWGMGPGPVGLVDSPAAMRVTIAEIGQHRARRQFLRYRPVRHRLGTPPTRPPRPTWGVWIDQTISAQRQRSWADSPDCLARGSDPPAF